ncbi:MAG: ABC transporter substrate-binding protein [Polyangiaceae bacterium]
MRTEKKLLGQPGGAATDPLFAWSTLEDYELDDYLTALGRAFPELRMTLVRTPTGELSERLRRRDFGERAPDLVLGTAATVLCEPEIAGLLAPVRIASAPASGPEGRWVAASGFRNAMAVNEAGLRARGLKVPETWAELADPAYRGLIVFPDPAVSGAGALALASLAQVLGPDGAFAIVSGIVENVAHFSPSSWSCATAALDPRTPVAVSVEIACLRLADRSEGVRVVVPEDASAVELEGFAMLSTAADPSMCERILSWVASDAHRAIARKWRKVTLGSRAEAEGPLAGGSFTLDHDRAARERALLAARFAGLREKSARSKADVSEPRSARGGAES